MNRLQLRSFAAVTIACAMLCAGSAAADPPGHRPGHAPNGRYYYDRYYQPRGYVVHQLPRHHHVAHYGHDRYYYGGGVWYRPYGPYYTVIGPPVGIAVSFLPNFYTTLWFGGVPYYYANSTYYVRRSDGPGYVVTEPPGGDPERNEPATTAAGEDFFMYPREGQSEDDQARDRYECHRWAVSQTCFDPASPRVVWLCPRMPRDAASTCARLLPASTPGFTPCGELPASAALCFTSVGSA
jgi:hypothetical protein